MVDLGFQFDSESVSSTIAVVGAFWQSFHILIELIFGVLLGLLVLEVFTIFRK